MAEMENVSSIPLKQPIVFTVEGFIITRHQGYIVFPVTLIAYVVMLLGNITVVTVIAADSKLHKPKYLMMCNLAACDMIGGTVVTTQLMSSFLTGDKTIGYVAAVFQSFFLHLYGRAACTIMSAMAYDRYVAICKPLHYHSIMTTGRLFLLCFMAWFIPFCVVLTLVILMVRTPLCGTLIKHIYCSNQAILRLACKPTPTQDAYYLWGSNILVIASFLIVIFSYAKILFACVIKQEKHSRSKAIHTCASHLSIYIVFELSFLFIIVAYSIKGINPNIKKYCGVLYVMVPPTINPIIYGIATRDIRKRIAKFFKSIVLLLPVSTAQLSK